MEPGAIAMSTKMSGEITNKDVLVLRTADQRQFQIGSSLTMLKDELFPLCPSVVHFCLQWLPTKVPCNSIVTVIQLRQTQTVFPCLCNRVTLFLEDIM